MKIMGLLLLNCWCNFEAKVAGFSVEQMNILKKASSLR